MLAALCATFILSNAFRTVATVMAGALQAEFAATPQQLGLFAGTFHLAFGLSQIFVGVALDLYGTRLTVAVAWLVALAGVLLSAFAPSLAVLDVGQFLIGVGCAPAFLATLVFVANSWPPAQFARLSGLVLAVGGIGMLLTGKAMGFVAILGVLALSGMIIRNSVILIDQIQKHLEAGETPWDAVVDSAVLRFRPIMLTAAAAILGMLPLMPSTFWGPMAVAIASGLLVATVLTLLVLPTMYAAMYKIHKP